MSNAEGSQGLHAIRVLFVCTGNQHRSPIAQMVLSRQLAIRGIGAVVGSVGLVAGGRPLPPETRDALVARGIEAGALGSFRSTELTADAVESADLVLGLAREHVREVVVRVPSAWGRTFTLKELVRRGEEAPRYPGEPLGAWLERVSNGRQRSELLGSSTIDDVADPMGGSPRDFERTAWEIEQLCATLVSLVWPSEHRGVGRTS